MGVLAEGAELVAEPEIPGALPASFAAPVGELASASRLVSARFSFGWVAGLEAVAAAGASTEGVRADRKSLTARGGLGASRLSGSTAGLLSRARGANRGGRSSRDAARAEAGRGSARGAVCSRMSIRKTGQARVIHVWPASAYARPTWANTDSPIAILKRRRDSRANTQTLPRV